MEKWQEAYKKWKETHRVSLMVYTDEQIFKIGFEYGETEKTPAPLEQQKKSRVKKP
jgi:hypothetical protein